MRRAELTALRRARGAKGRRDGRAAEWLAALWLMARGWRVLAMRLKTPHAEIDLLVRRGGVLAVVEVKRRPTMALAPGRWPRHVTGIGYGLRPGVGG